LFCFGAKLSHTIWNIREQDTGDNTWTLENESKRRAKTAERVSCFEPFTAKNRRDQISEDEMGGARSMHGEMRNE
jgi:hypothetical protein